MRAWSGTPMRRPIAALARACVEWNGCLCSQNDETLQLVFTREKSDEWKLHPVMKMEVIQ
jgi:hypothetical protein